MKDRYQIISTLSSGGTGTIQQAWDSSANRDVAIKRLHSGQGGVDALLWEARALYGLRHPHIVTIHEYDRDEEGAYLVMELIKGESLEHRLARGPLDLADFKTLVHQTLEAIGAAHDAGLIHRDLKPENLMLPWNREGSFGIKIIDFGLAQQGDGQQGSMTGSIHYMAPEQFGSGHVDARTDLYALGCIYYEALTGQPAFPGEEKIQVITAHLYPPRLPLADLRPDLRDQLCAWVDWLMHVQPAMRPASAQQALASFRALGSQLLAHAAAGVTEEEAYADVMVLEEEELPAVIVEDEPEEEMAVLTEYKPEVEAEVEPEPESKPEIAALREEEPEPEAAIPPPPPVRKFETASVIQAPVEEAQEPPRHGAAKEADVPATSRRMAPAPASSQPRPKRRSSLNLIITAFVVILVAQFALVSYFKYAGREGREQRLAELSSSEQPEGSDVDVRTLLDFLRDPAHQEQAVKALTRLRGGSYIDTLIQEYLEEVKTQPVALPLIQIVGNRRNESAFDTLVELTTSPKGEVRKAAWVALGQVTGAERLPLLLKQVRNSSKTDQPGVEKALVAAIEGSQDRAQATQHTLQAYHNATDHAESRSLLFNVLTRVGGDDILGVVTQAISDPSQKLRLAAITVLAEYPTHEPLTTISERFPVEADETCRMYLLLAARELVGKPGPSSQQTLFRHAQGLYGSAKSSEEKQYVLNVFSRIIAPGTAAFFENFDDPADPELSREARQIGESFRNRLARITSVTPDGKATPVPVDKADLSAEGTVTYSEIEKALVNWTQTTDWASWLVELPRNGSYEIAVYQAHDRDETGTYEILVAGQTLLTAVVKTDGKEDFKGFVAGTITAAEPGIYRLRIRPRTIPPESDLIRIQKLVIKAK